MEGRGDCNGAYDKGRGGGELIMHGARNRLALALA